MVEPLKIDNSAQQFGLPLSLLIPIAASDLETLEVYVGAIQDKVIGRKGRVNAVSVKPHNWPPIKEPTVKLWNHARSNEFEERLHPGLQVWVHVDYSGYRNAYQKFDTSPIPANFFLDHIQNREAIRLRNYSHPYLRLCPVHRRVNTSGGHNSGGEGMEKEFVRSLSNYSAQIQLAFQNSLKSKIVYADPMDLTKMLNFPTGTKKLEGVGEMQRLFYPN